MIDTDTDYDDEKLFSEPDNTLTKDVAPSFKGGQNGFQVKIVIFQVSNKEKWLEVTRRGDWFPSKFSVVCSRHFTDDCFVATKCRRRLLDRAIPPPFSPILANSNANEASSPTSSQITLVGVHNWEYLKIANIYFDKL
ncbi:hypothetical protein ACJJTC_007448 [Scirpophaga incertulas]